MAYRLNFSYLIAHLLQLEKITIREITEVFQGDGNHTVWDSLPQYAAFGVYYYLIGFSSQKRFLQIALNCDGDEIYFLDVKTAGLAEIRSDFFRL